MANRATRSVCHRVHNTPMKQGFEKSMLKSQHRVKRARSIVARATETEINLDFRPPYDWQTIIRFYMSHPIPGIERVAEESFERVFRLGTTIGFFQVKAMINKPQLKLKIVPANPKIVFEVVRRV